MSWQRRFCIFLFLINAHFQGWGFFLKVLVLLFFFLTQILYKLGLTAHCYGNHVFCSSQLKR